MNKVLILTKTNWAEAPRIRHQITRLLLARNFEIVFVEKNSYRNFFIKKRKEEGIVFYGHAELVHHQLRYFPFIQYLNNAVVKYYLKKIIREVEFDFIFNFSYEYSFLKELTDKRIVTMIEDDFESQAKFAMTKQIRNQVAKTCKNSDVVLTVSYPLFDKLIKHNPNVKMVFPWSQNRYDKPTPGKDRNTVLYFGYVHRLDWGIIEKLIAETSYTYRFIGPAEKAKDKKMIRHLDNTYQNFEYIPYSTLKDLKLDDVFCSILPYDATLKSIQAATVSNRSFNLLSLGLPLVFVDLKYLIEAPATVIRKSKTVNDYKENLLFFKNSFDDVQGDIESFLSNHYEENRWQILKEAIEG